MNFNIDEIFFVEFNVIRNLKLESLPHVFSIIVYSDRRIDVCLRLNRYTHLNFPNRK